MNDKGTKRPSSQNASKQPSKTSETRRRNRASTNRSFTETTTTIRNGVIDQCIKLKEAHLVERRKEGKSQVAQGFMQKMLARMNATCPGLDIERDDVENEIKRRTKEAKKKEAKSNKAATATTNPPVPPPTFVVEGRRLSTTVSSSASSSRITGAALPPSQPNTSSVPPSQQGNSALNVLATLAGAATTAASTLSSRIMLTAENMKNFALPNRCSFQHCGALLNSVPDDCRVCGSQKVHPICYMSKLNCWCSPEEIKCAACLAVSQESSTSSNAAASSTNIVESSTNASSSFARAPANVVESSSTNNCAYECCAMLSPKPTVPCSKCRSGIHQACQSAAEKRMKWSKQTIQFCDKCHPKYDTARTQSSTHLPTSTSLDAGGPSLAESQQPSAPTQRLKGGRPAGTTDKDKQEQIFNEKMAVNWVCQEYDKHVKAVKESNRRRRRASEKAKRVETGTRARLVAEAKEKFNIKDKSFDVPKQTINNRIKSENLEVWHPGSCSPIAMVEVIIKAHIIAAARVNAPLSVTNIITLANKLIEGTTHETELREWKQKHCYYDPAAPLLGRKWFANFMKRNPDLESKYGQKFARNRDAHTHDAAFTKMSDQIEVVLLESGNAKAFDEPVHMDREGNIVHNASEGFGRPVTIDITEPSNVLVMDETGDNTHGKDDGNNAGEKKVVPKGQIPKERVGIKDAHYTVLPVNDVSGRLRCLAVIFKGEKLSPSLVLGCDVFADWDDDDYISNFGPGKRYPSLPIHDHEGNDVPVVFAATPNASMTSTVLMQVFKKMDEKGISKREYDSNGKLVKYPVVILDGHVSRMGEDYLVYINEDKTYWGCVLGAPYGTAIYQFHDDKRQNGRFKCELAKSKTQLFLKKRLHDLDPEVLPEEIVIILRPAIEKSFANISYAKSALAIRGLYPYNRNYLDDPEILSTASQETQAERTVVLQSRGETSNLSQMGMPSQRDLLATGSGLFAGGAAASGQLQDTLRTVNLQNTTTEDVMSLIQKETALNEGRGNAYTSGQRRATKEELTNVYSKAKRLTAGEVFGNGNGRLGEEVRDAVVARNLAADQHEATKAANRKARLRELWKKVKTVRREMKKKKFKWTNKKLQVLCQWKKISSDKKMPSDKKGLLERWEEVKDRPHSPNVSVHESDSDDVSSVDESMVDEDSDAELSASEEEESEGEEEEIPLEDGEDVETGLEFSDNDDYDDELSEEEDGSEDEGACLEEDESLQEDAMSEDEEEEQIPPEEEEVLRRGTRTRTSNPRY